MPSEQQERLNSAIVYKGCTRPPMVFGVPVLAFVFGCGGAFVLGAAISPPFAAISVIVWWVMKQMCRTDEMIFHVLYVKMITKLPNINRRHWKTDTYQPIAYRKKFKL